MTGIERDDIDAELARSLVAEQFPRWAGLPVGPVDHQGSDNRTFRLGEDLLIRLPTGPWYAQQVAKEQRWLPVLAPQLPYAIPEPVAAGVRTDRYPYAWSVYRWLPGRPVTAVGEMNLRSLAADLAAFLSALYSIDATDGPPPGEHNFFRGAPPKVYDAEVRTALATLGDAVPAGARDIWEAGLRSRWANDPVWFHGDVAAGNLLVGGGRLSAVIDFGSSGVGDPACDLAVAWNLFGERERLVFRDGLPLDRDTWARGRAWTVWKALITLAAGPDPGARRTLERLLEDREA